MLPKLVLYTSFSQETSEYWQIASVSAKEVMVPLAAASKSRIRRLQNWGIEIGVVVEALPGNNICPASADAKEHLVEELQAAMGFSPSIIWLDHFRFEGDWESARDKLEGTHDPCRDCKGRSRTEVLEELGRLARKVVERKISLGYYAVPFRMDEHEPWLKLLGQDHRRLSRVFEAISPMLYHRLLGKPPYFIGSYLQYLTTIGVRSKVVPIVQLTDLGAEGTASFSCQEMSEVLVQASQAPATSIAIFTWDHLVFQGKVQELRGILRQVFADSA